MVGDATSRDSPQRPRRGGLRWDDLALLNEQIVTIAESGLPLPASLRAVAKDLENRKLRPILEAIAQDLEKGVSLEEAFSRRPDVFSPTYRAVIRAGEQTGRVSETLAHLASYSSRMVEMRNHLHEVLAYPILLAVLLLAGTAVFHIVVFPRLVELVHAADRRMPAITQLYYDLTLWSRSYGLPLVVILGLGATALFLVPRSTSFRLRLDAAFERVLHVTPVIGPAVTAAARERFTRVLAILLEHRIDLPTGVTLASQAGGGRRLAQAGQEAAESVQQGARLADALAATGAFSQSFCWMIAQGETAGNLPVVLERMAKALEREVAQRYKWIQIFAGPFFTVVIGLLVGSAVIAVFLPVLGFGQFL